MKASDFFYPSVEAIFILWKRKKLPLIEGISSSTTFHDSFDTLRMVLFGGDEPLISEEEYQQEYKYMLKMRDTLTYSRAYRRVSEMCGWSQAQRTAKHAN